MSARARERLIGAAYKALILALTLLWLAFPPARIAGPAASLAQHAETMG
jgi:hypothetical protein